VQAVNLTTSPLELDPVNGPGMLAAAVESSDGEHVRELVEYTDREKALVEAGLLAVDGAPEDDRYDGLDRDALQAEADERGLAVEREDGREDLPPKESELRHALRVADTTGGAE
jgi:hypothetical protein